MTWFRRHVRDPRFLSRWEASGASERPNYQLFLAELCDQLGVDRPKPSTPDALAKRFQGARVAQVALLLEAMAALGQVREFEGRYAA